MSTFDSTLMSEELSVELDEEEQLELIEAPIEAEKENISFKLRPLRIADIKLNVSSQFRIRDLTQEARRLLADHLDLFPVGSLKCWQNIAEYFGAGTDIIMGISKNSHATLTLLERYGSKKAEELIFALERSYRLDTLYSLRLLLNEGDLFEIFTIGEVQNGLNKHTPTFSNASTILQNACIVASTSNHSQPINTGEPEILIVHYESNKAEIKQYKWLMSNLKTGIEKFGLNTKLIDCQSMISDKNVWELMEKGFQRAESVVFCFNPSLIALLDLEEPTDMNMLYVKRILGLATAEFYSNGGCNLRFRPVYFQSWNVTRPTVGWISSTLSYDFPDQFESLGKKLFKLDYPKQ